MIRNLERSTYLSRHTFHATRLWDRIRGMIGRDFNGSFDAMVFAACNAIHTFFMRIALDVIFLDRDNRVIGMRRGLKPWHPCIWVLRAKTVIELPVGAIDSSGTSLGDLLDLAAGTGENGC